MLSNGWAHSRFVAPPFEAPASGSIITAPLTYEITNGNFISYYHVALSHFWIVCGFPGLVATQVIAARLKDLAKPEIDAVGKELFEISIDRCPLRVIFCRATSPPARLMFPHKRTRRSIIRRAAWCRNQEF